MKRNRSLFTFTTVLMLGTASHAAIQSPSNFSNRYEDIAKRNVFNLKGPEDIPVVTKKDLPPGIILTGITRFPRPCAYFTVVGRSPSQTIDCVLIAGEVNAGVKVLAIDVENQNVTVDNHGVVERLDFVKNAAKVNHALAAAATPGGVNATPTLSRPVLNHPGRPAAALPPRADPKGQTDERSELPTATVPQKTGNVSLEEQALLIELQREEMRMRNDPGAELVPPTQLTPR